MVFAHPMVGFYVAAHRLKGGAAFQLCFEVGLESLSPQDEDPPRWARAQPRCWIGRMLVLLEPPKPFVNIGAFRRNTIESDGLFQHLAKRVAVKRITLQCICVEGKHPTYPLDTSRTQRTIFDNISIVYGDTLTDA